MSPAGLAILTAVLLAFSFSNFNFWLLAWCSFIPLFIALENQSLRRAFLIALFCGIVFWSLTVYWLIHVTLLGQIILIFYLAIYFGLFGCLFYFLRFLPVCLGLFFLASGWVLLEYLRSHLFTGFPWVLIGFSQYKNLPVIQIADITGVWGVCFLVVLINVALYLFLRKAGRVKVLCIAALALFLSLGYGWTRLNCKPDGSSEHKQFKISVIQGNIHQDLKWDKRAVTFIQNRYRDLTVEASKQEPELIIWPESSVPGLWGRDDLEFMQVFSLAGRLHTNLLIGAVACFNQDYFNSALLIDQRGSPAAFYSKLHLVPFGEYIPLKNIFPFLETIVPIGDIQPGREYTIFKQPADFGVLICFEDLFPELSREFVRRGAKFLVNITNDAWYKEGSAPYQHFAASVFRSVENRVYLARAANTGISGFIDPSGRILGVVRDAQGKEIFVQGYLTRSIGLAKTKRTFYNRYGDFFIVFCWLLDACAIIIILKKKK
ncbi:MAG TPA: apolipoprotein N-acyltransferase [Candidatus Omnitrophota bacterium]|nr:apolipoprotein N-acyltransferase [Candidatus Omnitrophota bacterium]HPT38777.1 apolipoprotein N-acyltransferase [Candidatus Omnitrophota bacterium]